MGLGQIPGILAINIAKVFTNMLENGNYSWYGKYRNSILLHENVSLPEHSSLRFQ